jgi:hypothetical protein
MSDREWLLLVVSLPTGSATARMRIWRAIRALGCAALRDGAYLLPQGADRAATLRDLADACTREGGTAWLMAVRPCPAEEDRLWRQLFTRHEDYQALREAWKALGPGLAAMPVAELARSQRRLRRDFEAVKATDFFPDDTSAEAEASWVDLDRRIQRLLAPDEPQETEGPIPRLDAARYQGRVWATRARPWVDRVASAWLIRRFIDRDARFLWLASPSDCPKDALGFDFDGATFTHVGDRVTFETLMAGFGLDEDPALRRLAEMVHALDVGGEPVPEAKGFEAMLSGARERIDDDDALMAEIAAVLDSLHAHFQREVARHPAK